MSEGDKRLIKSYVWYEDKCFFISTINRDSSAMYGPRRFAETIIWAYDWEKRERLQILDTFGDSEGRVSKHLNICKQISETGEYFDD